jgi:hypothetical protein
MEFGFGEALLTAGALLVVGASLSGVMKGTFSRSRCFRSR